MEILLQILFSGCAVGMIYAVIAFGYQLTFATSGTLNFGQGEALAIGALVGLTLSSYLGYWAMIPIVLAFGACYGLFVERVGVRPAMKLKSEGWIMSTIAIGIILKNEAENLWGREDMRFPSPVSEQAFQIAGARVMPMEILVVLGALAMMLGIEFFNRKSIYGKAVVATAVDREAAGLMGVNTGKVISFSYALSCATAAFAGVLIAPLTLVGAGMGASLGPEGARRSHHRWAHLGPGRHRWRPDSGSLRDRDGLLLLHRLQRRAWPAVAAPGPFGKTRWPARQSTHQEGVK
ncbi:branched-chain amino acid transport system permease protein [Variovorax sp. OAS795]